MPGTGDSRLRASRAERFLQSFSSIFPILRRGDLAPVVPAVAAILKVSERSVVRVESNLTTRWNMRAKTAQTPKCGGYRFRSVAYLNGSRGAERHNALSQ